MYSSPWCGRLHRPDKPDERASSPISIGSTEIAIALLRKNRTQSP
ncbi:MAG TPA: hypothetical protein V6C85_36660 [Allocoleopsis sp.]